MGMQIGAILSRKIWQYRMKLNTRSPLNPATPLQGIYPEPRPPTMWKCICKTFFIEAAAAAAKSLQSCQTLCNPIDGSPPGSLVPGILQARTLEWVAISFSNAWKWKVKVKSLSRVRPLATPRTAAYQAPPSMGFSRQEYWSGLPLPSPSLKHYFLIAKYWEQYGLPRWLSGKESTCQCRRQGLIPDLRRSHIPRSNQVPAPQLLSLCSRAREPQLLSPHAETT